MDDAAFRRDRLTEAVKRLGARVAALKALEKARVQRAEYDRVSQVQGGGHHLSS
jgi:hypothetical protein